MSNDEMTVVPRELVKDVADCVLQGHSSRYLASALQACLDAPAPRVVGPGDVVVPAMVAEKIVSVNIKTGAAYADCPVTKTVPLADALEAGNT